MRFKTGMLFLAAPMATHAGTGRTDDVALAYAILAAALVLILFIWNSIDYFKNNRKAIGRRFRTILKNVLQLLNKRSDLQFLKQALKS